MKNCTNLDHQNFCSCNSLHEVARSHSAEQEASFLRAKLERYESVDNVVMSKELYEAMASQVRELQDLNRRRAGKGSKKGKTSHKSSHKAK